MHLFLYETNNVLRTCRLFHLRIERYFYSTTLIKKRLFCRDINRSLVMTIFHRRSIECRLDLTARVLAIDVWYLVFECFTSEL